MGVEEATFGKGNALHTGVDTGVVEIRPEGILEMLVPADWGTGVSMNWEGFNGPSLVLKRLVGELKAEGLMFSESKSSSKNEGEYGRLPALELSIPF